MPTVGRRYYGPQDEVVIVVADHGDEIEVMWPIGHQHETWTLDKFHIFISGGSRVSVSVGAETREILGPQVRHVDGQWIDVIAWRAPGAEEIIYTPTALFEKWQSGPRGVMTAARRRA